MVARLSNAEGEKPRCVGIASRGAGFSQLESYASPSLSKAQRDFVLKKLAPKVVVSLEEAGQELLTFYRFPKSQWKVLRTTNAIERLNGEFRLRVKTQGSLPDTNAAERLLFGWILNGQIQMRRIDG